VTKYRLDYEPQARRQLRAIKDRRLLVAIERALAGLMDDPRPHGCLKLAGQKDHWRVRVGDWRIVYRIEDGRLVIVVVRVAPRSGAYG
jgi:mRNA interferase RelE/StbE